MIVRTAQAEIDAYFADTEHVSQGKLKKLLKGVDVYNKEYDERELYYEEKEHLNIGNAVDVILTQGREEFERQFAVLLIEKPGDKLMSVIQFIFDRYIIDKEEEEIRHSSLSMNIASSEILDAASAEDYQRKYKDATIISTVTRDAGDYFDSLCMNHGKKLLSAEEAGKVEAIVESLKTNELTAAFFEDELPEGMDIYFQLPIYFVIDGVQCKVLIDMLLIDHNNKWFAPYDLKTMGDYTVNFIRSAMRYRYDIQAAFYTEATIQAMNDEERWNTLTGYANAPFRFIVESSSEQGNPLVYQVNSELLAMGTFGRPEGYSLLHTENEADSRQVHHQAIYGYKYAMELYQWHVENGFEKDRIVVQNQGIMNLGWNRSY